MHGTLDFDTTPSATERVVVPCPACRREFGHDAWKAVNARSDRLLAARVRDASLFSYTCPHCGYTDYLVHACLFLDPESRSCIHLVTSPEMAAMAEVVFDGYEMDDGRGGVDGSRRRIVFNRFDLREKARAFDDGIDDRAIELVKLDVAGTLGSERTPFGISDPEIHYAYARGSLIGLDVFYGNRKTDIVVPRDIYDSYASAISSSSLAGRESYYVDRQWARQAVEVLDGEHVL